MTRSALPLISLLLAVVASTARGRPVGRFDAGRSLLLRRATTTASTSRESRRRGDPVHDSLAFLTESSYANPTVAAPRGGASTAIKTMTYSQREALK